MAASNTPINDLIELTGIGAFATYTTAAGGSGDILGVVDGSLYTDGDGSNTATDLRELNETGSGNGGTLEIEGVLYSFTLAVPDGSGNDVTITYDNGASSVNLSGDGGSSNIVFFQASPQGGGATRYFAAVDDDIGDLLNITAIQTRGLDFSPAGDDVTIDLDQDNAVTACFAQGTLIATPDGPIPVEALKSGALVNTLDEGPLPVRWVCTRRFSPTELAQNAHSKPVFIPAGVLGAKQPLRLSRQHCVLINPEADRDRQMMARAGLVASMPGAVRLAKGAREVSYHHILLPAHHLIYANGVLCETFYPGPIALATLPAKDRAAIRWVLPDGPKPHTKYGKRVRPIVPRHALRRFAPFVKAKEKVSQHAS